MKKLLYVLITILLVVGLVGCGVGATSRQQAEYLKSLDELMSSALTVGVRAETLSGAVQRLWRETIDGRGDFDDALRAFSSHENVIASRAEIQDMRREVVAMYLNLGAPPEGLERAGEVASAMYESLDILIDLADNPSGSFNSFSASRRERVDEFMRNHRLLGDIIDAFGDR